MIAILSLIAVNVPLNLFVVYFTDWGIIGIAWASFISMVLFNLLKLLFIYKKFRLLPFDAAFGKLFMLFAVSGTAIYLLPETGSNLIDLVYKTGLSLIVNVVAIYKLRLVYQVNLWVDKALRVARK